MNDTNEPSTTDEYARGWDDGWDEGYTVAMAQIVAGEAHPMEWDGSVYGDRQCEACEQMFPESEYGFSLHDELWAQVAPRPDADYFGSGVLCMDCIQQRLGREVTMDDVQILAMYGERPTYRAAYLALGPYLAFGEHLMAEDDSVSASE